MIYTAIALVMTVIMGGIIAYYGDLTGRKYGKRRVSLLGLRPKYTAILITSLSGTAISAVTTGVLFLLVPPVRAVILDGERAIRETAIDKAEEVRAKADANLARVQEKEAARERSLAEKARADAMAQLTPAKRRLAEDQVELARTQGQLRDLEGKIRGDRATLARLQERNSLLAADYKQLSTKNAALRAHNQELAQNNTALAKQNYQLAVDRQKKIRQNAELEKQNQEIARQNDDLVRQNTDLTKQGAALTRVNDNLRSYETEQTQRNQTLREDNARLISQNQQLATTNSALVATLTRLGPQYATISEAYLAARSRRVVVHQAEDLARVVVPSHSTPSRVRQILDGLLHEAGQAALARGAGLGSGSRAVQVVGHATLSERPGGFAPDYEESGADVVGELVDQLAYQQSDWCVLTVAVANSVQREPAIVDLEALPSRTVYEKGDEVASHRVNAGEPVKELFEELVAFLKSAGRDAMKVGVIPSVDATGDPEVGALDAGDVAHLCEEIHQRTGYVNVRAVAASRIASPDRLALAFRIEP